MGRNAIPAALAALILAAGLGACGAREAPPEQETASPTAILSVYDVPGEESSGERLGQPVDDGLTGSYYNDFLRLALTLDGSGGCTLSGPGGVETGAYRPEEGGGLALEFADRTERAAVDGDGDIQIDGRDGYFLRDWVFWGVTPEEAGVEAPTVTAAPDPNTEILDNGDGTYRFRDLKNAIAFTYPDGMRVLTGALTGGAAVRDGDGGSVTGRNVTELYRTSSGSDDEFLADYIKTFVFSDFTLLYGGIGSYESLAPVHENIDGRLAAYTLQIHSGGGEDYLVRVILYTSTYADGTVNYICKTVFAPSEDAARLDALGEAVTGMGAVRLTR